MDIYRMKGTIAVRSGFVLTGILRWHKNKSTYTLWYSEAICYLKRQWLLLLFKLNINMARVLKKHIEDLFNRDIILRLNREPSLMVSTPTIVNNIPSKVYVTLNFDGGKFFKIFLSMVDERLTIGLGEHNFTDLVVLHRIHNVFDPATMEEIVRDLAPFYSKAVIDDRKGWSGNIRHVYHKMKWWGNVGCCTSLCLDLFTDLSTKLQIFTTTFI